MNVRQVIKKIIQLTTTIFTILVLLYLLTGKPLNNQMLIEFLICSVGAALIKCIFFPEVLFELTPSKQLLYLLSVWLMIIAANFLLRWQMAIREILLTAVEVIIIYFCIRIINYKIDKTETRKMNEILEKKRKSK